jgi:polyphosphate kinase
MIKAGTKSRADALQDEKQAVDERKPGAASRDGKAPVVSTPADRIPVPEPGDDGVHDLTRSEYFLNRELTWLNFNFRVLHEADDKRTPLLERIRFITIVSSNIDEFFMKRIGGLKQQVGAGIQERTVDGRTPEGQIAECYQVVRELEVLKRSALTRLLSELRLEGISIVPFEALSASEKKHIREFFIDNIFPLLTPQSTDPAHPFPFVSNLSLNLLVTLHYPEEPTPSVARVKVPVGVDNPRFLKLPDADTFVPLESVIAHNLDMLFPGMVIDSCYPFRVTRNANTDIQEEDADDLLALIETGLRRRRFAPIVRLEVARGMEPARQTMLASTFGLQDPGDLFEVEGMLALADLGQLADLKYPHLRYEPHHPADHPSFVSDASVFHVLRESGSVLLHHPYESFETSVVRFIKEASTDPNVRGIKMTLYRTARQSKIMQYLMDAARNGKQVAVVLELQASFDEAMNIRWANYLEETGVHVTYGVMGLKTHCKAVLVIRQDDDVLRRYAHVGTGNYHEGTARLYTDLGLLTCDETIGRDLTELFNYLTTGYKPKRNYTSLMPAPKVLKQEMIARINREIEHQKKTSSGHIQLKMNALEDGDVTLALYQAAREGVTIDLIVRDTCRLRPGIKGLSESVTVVSIVGRFLEHSRVFYFRNGGEEEYYIGSADFMKRNLESRVEILAPVKDESLRQDLRFLLDTCMEDHRNGWEMRSDGSYVQRQSTRKRRTKGAQATLVEWAEKRAKDSSRLKRRQVRALHTVE